MKLSFISGFLLLLFFSNAEAKSPYESIELKNYSEFQAMQIILMDTMIKSNNFAFADYELGKSKDKEIRLKAEKCYVKDLTEIQLRLYDKYKNLIPSEHYGESINKIRTHLIQYERDLNKQSCDEIKKLDRINWTTIETINS